MVFHLPAQDSLRTHATYTEIFALTLLWNISIGGIIVTVLLILLLLLKQYQIRTLRNNMLKDSMLSLSQNTQSARLSGEQKMPSIPVDVNPQTMSFKIVNRLTSILFYTFWIILSLIYLCFYMFGYMSRGTHIDILSVGVMLCAVLIPTLIWKHGTKVEEWGKLRGQLIFTSTMLVIWLGICITLVLITKGACVCYYNDNYGFPVAKDAKMSTQFTRTQTLEQPCKKGQLCHLYATLPEDGSTGVFFNAHTHISMDTITFTLSREGQFTITQQSNDPFLLENVEQMGQRAVHSALFQGLTGNTTYRLTVKSAEGSQLKSIRYKTVPDRNTSELRLAMGGDVGMTKSAKQMTMKLISFKPDVIVIGGDIVYDDGMRTCYYSWDNFYSIFEPLYDSLGRLVPFVFSVGNHDVGFDALTENQIDNSTHGLPLYLAYNPQHSPKQNKINTSQAILLRKSYHYHIIGQIIHFNLDSGYITPYADQVPFIKDTIQKYPKYYRFANYHNPIYPSCTNTDPDSNDVKVITEGQKQWIPIFDQLHFVAALEHHTHYMKMTHPIFNSTQHPKGTRYLGDGSWGVNQGPCSTQKVSPYMGLLEHHLEHDPTHVWEVVLTTSNTPEQTVSVTYTAINIEGKHIAKSTDELGPL